MTTWLEFFGFSEEPFSKDLDDAALWLPKRRLQLLDQMQSALHERGHILLVGEPGVGKTSLLRALRARLNTSKFRFTYCHNTTLGRRDFYRQLSLALGIKPYGSAASVFYQISADFEALASQQCHPVLVLDEAHLLHQDVCDHLHMLCNFQWDQKPLLSLVLLGLPELLDRLNLRKNRSLLSRIHTRVKLAEAIPADTCAYVQHRLARVLGKDVFATDALTYLHEASTGRLRDIDRLATLALKRAATLKRTIVDRDIVAHVIAVDSNPESEALHAN